MEKEEFIIEIEKIGWSPEEHLLRNFINGLNKEIEEDYYGKITFALSHKNDIIQIINKLARKIEKTVEIKKEPFCPPEYFLKDV